MLSNCYGDVIPNQEGTPSNRLLAVPSCSSRRQSTNYIAHGPLLMRAVNASVETPPGPISKIPNVSSETLIELNACAQSYYYPCIRGHSVESTRPPRHTKIGTVSLLASSRCVRVSEVGPTG